MRVLQLSVMAVFLGMAVSAQAQDRRDHRDHEDHRDPSRPRIVTCSSNSYDYTTCDVGFEIGDIRLRQQISRKSDCIEGRSYGIFGTKIWVDHGCRGEFEVFPARRATVIECASDSYRYNSCPVGFMIERVDLVQQLSKKVSCVEGRTYGADRDRVWVDQGCRGQFRVYPRRHRP